MSKTTKEIKMEICPSGNPNYFPSLSYSPDNHGGIRVLLPSLKKHNSDHFNSLVHCQGCNLPDSKKITAFRVKTLGVSANGKLSAKDMQKIAINLGFEGVQCWGYNCRGKLEVLFSCESKLNDIILLGGYWYGTKKKKSHNQTDEIHQENDNGKKTNVLPSNNKRKEVPFEFQTKPHKKEK